MNPVVALVPMRGQSERVPRKNLRPFGGKPLFFHVLGTLRKAKGIGEIYVDTDSPEIAAIARQEFGVQTIDRPQHLRGDMVPMTDILRHDVGSIDADIFLQTHATNPLLRPETVERAIQAFHADRARESLASMTPLRKRFFFSDGRAMNHDPKVLLRTQDLPPVYEENSCLYIFRKEFLLRTGLRFDSKALLFEMDPIEATDIDTETDFRMAECLYRVLQETK